MSAMYQLRKLVDKHPAPVILEQDIESKVFTHKSFYSLPAHVQVRSEEPADWERLAFLGDQIISLWTTDVIFERYPHARSSFLTNKRSLVVSNDQIAKWSQAYGFPAKIRAQPSQMQLLKSSVVAQASVFEAYVGGLYQMDGLTTVERWLKPLIRFVLDEAERKEKEEEEDDEPQASIGNGEDDAWNRLPELEQSFARMETRAQNLVDEEEVDELYPGDSMYSTPLSQNSLLRPGSSTPKAQVRSWGSAPAMSTPGTPGSLAGPFQQAGEPARIASKISVQSALKFRPTGGPSTIPGFPTNRTVNSNLPPPSHYSDPLPTSSAPSPGSFSPMSQTTGNGFLALFNQLASQKHIDPVWTTASSGPPHKPTFEAKVKVGSTFGVGKAHNKQAARQIAARDALVKLKWHSE